MQSNVNDLIESLDVLVWEKNPATLEFVHINPPTEVIFGYPTTQWLTEKNLIANHIHPEDIQRFVEFYQQICHSSKAQEIEYQIFDSSGKILRLRDRVKAIKNQIGQTEKLAGFTIKISENSIQPSNQVQQKQEQFYPNFDNLSDGFVILKSIRNQNSKIIDFKIEYINPAACKNSQLSKEQQIGKNLCELFPEYRNLEIFDEYVQVVETGQPLSKEYINYPPESNKKNHYPAYNLNAGKLGDSLVVSWQNITESKQIEQKLQRYQTELNKILDNIPIIISRLDPQLRFLYINAPITHATGLYPENFIGKTHQEISCFAGNFEQWQQKYQQVLTEKKARKSEIEWKTANGETLYYWCQIIPELDQQNNVESLLSICYNITEQKRSQENLKIYSDLVKNVPLSLSVWQLENNNDPGSFRLKACNPAASEETNINLQNYLGTTIAESFPAILQTSLPEKYAEVLRTGITKNIKEIYYPDQHLLSGYYSLKIFPLPNNCIGLALENITERKQLEQALQKSEEKFRQLAEFMPLIVWCTTPDGAISYINERGSSYTGLNRENLQGWGWQTVLHPHDLPTTLQSWQHSLQTGQPYKMEYRLRQHSDQQYRWHLARAEAIRDEQGNIQGWFGSCTDIHDKTITTQKAQFLAEVTPLLANSPDIETALPSVVKLALPTFADYCAIDLEKPDGSFQRTAASTNSQSQELFKQIQERFPNKGNPKNRLSKVWETRQPYLVPELTTEHLQACAADSQHLEALKQSGIKSLISLPLIARDHLLGAIHFATLTEGSRYNETDLTWAQDIARRIAVAIDNALLYKQTEEAERRKDESLARVNALLEGAPIGIAFFDRELRIVRMNNFLASLNEIPPELAIGRVVDELMPPAQAEWIKTRMQQVLDTGFPLLNLELTGPKASTPEKLVHMVVNYYPVAGTNGEIMGVGCAIADISDLKQAEIALRQSQERFRIAQELSLDGFIILRSLRNQENKIINFECEYLNPAAAKILRSTVEELADKKLLDFLDGFQSKALFERYLEVFETGISHDLEIEYKFANTNGWFRSMAVKLGDGVAISLTDITERKQASQQLHRREQEFRALVENSRDIIARLDKNLRHLYVNPAVEQITGISPQKLMGKTYAKFGFSEEIYLHCQDTFRQVFADKNQKIIEIDLDTPTGRRYLQTRIVPEFALNGEVETLLCVSRDISELKKAEKALRESESRFRRVFSSNMMGMGFWNKSSGVIEANDALLNLIGYTRQDFLSGNMNWGKITPEKYRHLDQIAIENSSENSICPVFEKEYIRKDGSLVPILIGGAMLENSQETGVFFVLDLSERKKVEQALRESEARFRTMADNSPTYIWMTDSNGHCTYFNRPWLEFKGYSTLEESLEKGWLDEMHPSDIDDSIKIYLKAFNARESFEMEYRHKRADGEYRWILDTGVPLYAPDGSFLGYIGSGIDITERREAEERLYETNLTLNRLIQSCPLAITVFDLETGIVKMWNPAAERIFGWTAEETIGKFIPSVSRGNLNEFLANIEVVREGGELAAKETKRLHKNGNFVEVAIWGARLVDANNNMSCLSIIADITENKRLEAERNQLLIREQTAREQAEKANRVKDEFLAVLSHELRSPLNAILGWAQMLRSRKFNEAMTNKALETIERNARLQSQLIEDLLDVSRILRGKVSLSLSPINLASVMEAAVDTVRLSATAKLIEIERFIQPNLGMVAGDGGRLQQVFWNLISNAIKFTSEGGRIEIRLSKVRGNDIETGEEEGIIHAVPKFELPMTNFAQIQVIDNGKGISREFLPSVFEYFRQADSSSTRAHGGLGLGLAIVRHLVELHGGMVKAYSKGEGYGATFTVWLPLLPTKNSGSFSETELLKEDVSSSDALLRGLQILVVDDDNDSREYIATVLEQAGAVVEKAVDVNAAIVSLCRVKPDVLVSDIGMPGQDGYTFIRRVRALEAEWRGNIPALALTAYATDDDRRRALEAGFQQHLSKPVQPNELLRIVAGLSGRSGYL
ncbi:MAG TPA: PAS domain S-box protein [Halomicronema sp.]